MQVIIEDDHKLIRDGISPFVKELDSNVQVLEAETLDGVLDHIAKADNLKLVLLDLVMPGMNSFTGLNAVVQKCTGIPVVVLSGYASREHVITAMRNGASGFIPKTVSGPTMVSALRLILSGEKYLPSSSFLDNSPGTTINPPVACTEMISQLTAREAEVMTLTVRGLTNRDIAQMLGVKEITVKVHLRNIYRKIGASNRAQAISLAMASGFDGGTKLI